MKLKGWMAYHRKVTLKPRVKYGGSIADRPNQTGMTHVYCGRGGRANLVAVIDCHGRELIGWEFALRALGTACIRRFGTLRVERNGPVLRSDNGLVFFEQEVQIGLQILRAKAGVYHPLYP